MVSPSDINYFQFDVLALSMKPEMYEDLRAIGSISIGTEIEMLSGRKVFRLHIKNIPPEKKGLKATKQRENAVDAMHKEHLIGFIPSPGGLRDFIPHPYKK